MGDDDLPEPLPEPGDPDPETIRRLCAEIRRRWSPEEHARRAGRGGAYVVPVVSADFLGG